MSGYVRVLDEDYDERQRPPELMGRWRDHKPGCSESGRGPAAQCSCPSVQKTLSEEFEWFLSAMAGGLSLDNQYVQPFIARFRQELTAADECIAREKVQGK